MLITLRVKNLALVADLTLELGPGLNVISGETGAGKSILIGALTLALGQRADRTLIRSGSDTCTVEAVFDVSRLEAPLTSFLEENGLEPCESEQLIIKRVFSVSGTNRQFVNGSPTSLATLASLGEWLVDIHGPHDHQSLLYPARQLTILDAFGKLQPLTEKFGHLLRRHSALEDEKSNLVVDDKTYAQQLDLLRFQVHEINAAKLRADEAGQLEADHRRSVNAARLLELGQQASALLNGEEASLLNDAGALGRTLQDLQRLDPAASSLTELHAGAVTAWHQLARELSHYSDRIDLDPAQLSQLEERVNLIQSLQRKYGASVQDVIDFGVAAKVKLEQLEQREEVWARLTAEQAKIAQELWNVGRDLSTRRSKLRPQLSKAVAKELSALGFKQSQFDLQIQSLSSDTHVVGDVLGTGLDRVDFQFSPNPGEPLRPLRTIASSGEMARVMLALKTVLAAEDDIPVLVFDEVDANVGGETATVVGEKMRQIARHRQVLCITHLAPVAAHADAHFVVTKNVENGRTTSAFAQLGPSERVSELARMLGGQTETARQYAASLLASPGVGPR
jgi:DNA repair protein RecN (Recombination protein N)